MATAQEPPMVTTTIPYIGHVIGFIRDGADYFVHLSQSNGLPIFSLNMFGQKVYIVTTTDLIHAAQKQPKVLAFPPIRTNLGFRISGVSQAVKDIVNTDLLHEEEETVMSMKVMRSALSPSEEFDDMNRKMIQQLLVSLDTLKQHSPQPVKMGLLSFVRSQITTSITNAVYGPQNPFRDQAVMNAFWQFQRDLTPMLIGVLPSITARNGISGRTSVARAFEQYFRDKRHESGSILVRKRYESAMKKGLSVEDTALLEVSNVIAMTGSTVPAAFWSLFFTYATPGVLSDMREEIQAVVTTHHSEHGPMRNVDIKSLKQRCPLLLSTFQETLRHRGIGVSVRKVMEDMILDDQWLLKKGSILQMPSRVIHKDQSLWGSNVDDFCARRFVKGQRPFEAGSGSNKRAPAAAFRGFGGGTTLCPGRHFATNEVIATVAMFVLRYDMAPASGSWSMPSTNNSSPATFLMEPKNDVEMEISVRKGYEEGSFACSLKESDEIVAVTAEDCPA